MYLGHFIACSYPYRIPVSEVVAKERAVFYTFVLARLSMIDKHKRFVVKRQYAFPMWSRGAQTYARK